MTERERFRAVLHFEEVDRVPNLEIGYWEETLVRWVREGLPCELPHYPGADDMRHTRHSRELADHFGIDAHDIVFGMNILEQRDPPPTSEVVAEDEDTRTLRYSDGRVIRCLKSNDGIFQEFAWPVATRDDWDRLRPTLSPGWHNVGISLRQAAVSPESLPPDDRDFPVMLNLGGFFMELRYLMGFERACTIFYEEPDLANDILASWCEYLLAQCKLVLERLKPDCVMFHEDMAYNHGPLISPAIFAEFIRPCYQSVVSCLNAGGVDVVGIDSDGFPDEIIPVLGEVGVNLWSPFEMVCRSGRDDLLTLGRKYPWLRILGGIDKAALPRGKEAIDRELSKVPPLLRRSGYIPTIDHKVSPEAPLAAYRYYQREKAKLLRAR